RIMFALDRHFDVAGISPAHMDRWDEVKRQVVRMKEGLDLALTVLVSGAPANEEKVRKTLAHVRFGLGMREGGRKRSRGGSRKPHRWLCGRNARRPSRCSTTSRAASKSICEWTRCRADHHIVILPRKIACSSNSSTISASPLMPLQPRSLASQKFKKSRC